MRYDLIMLQSMFMNLRNGMCFIKLYDELQLLWYVENGHDERACDVKMMHMCIKTWAW